LKEPSSYCKALAKTIIVKHQQDNNSFTVILIFSLHSAQLLMLTTPNPSTTNSKKIVKLVTRI